MDNAKLVATMRTLALEAGDKIMRIYDGPDFEVKTKSDESPVTEADEAADALRYVIKACVGEENFIDMYPNKSNNFCCGGGGGFLQSGYKDERLAYGKIKDDQIQATGATYAITGCHNCHAQVHELSEHYGGNYHVLHAWTIICLALGVLAPSERTYLGPELQEVNLPEMKDE